MPKSRVLSFIADPNGLESNVFLFDDFMGGVIDTGMWDTAAETGASISIGTPDSTDDGGVLKFSHNATADIRCCLGIDGSIKPYRLGDRAIIVGRIRHNFAEGGIAIGLSGVTVGSTVDITSSMTNGYCIGSTTGVGNYGLRTEAAGISDGFGMGGGFDTINSGWNKFMIDPESTTLVRFYQNANVRSSTTNIPSSTTML